MLGGLIQGELLSVIRIARRSPMRFVHPLARLDVGIEKIEAIHQRGTAVRLARRPDVICRTAREKRVCQSRDAAETGCIDHGIAIQVQEGRKVVGADDVVVRIVAAEVGGQGGE